MLNIEELSVLKKIKKEAQSICCVVGGASPNGESYYQLLQKRRFQY
jgi:hypothetical protein